MPFATLFKFLFYFIFADFYNWNRIKVRYCDGASFSGDSENQVCISANNYVSFRFTHVALLLGWKKLVERIIALDLEP